MGREEGWRDEGRKGVGAEGVVDRNSILQLPPRQPLLPGGSTPSALRTGSCLHGEVGAGVNQEQ